MRLGPWEAWGPRGWCRRDAKGWPCAAVDRSGWRLNAAPGKVGTSGSETGAAGREAADRAARAMGWELQDDEEATDAT